MRIEERNGELTVVDFSEFTAYRIACKIEKDGIKFYRKVSSGLENAEAREMLEFLIEEERKHLKFFEDCLLSAREGGEDDSEDDDLISAVDFGIFQPYQNMADLEKAVKDTRKALQLGMVVENKSIKFYEACLKNVSSPDTRREIGNIIEEEKRHAELLKGLSGNLP